MAEASCPAGFISENDKWDRSATSSLQGTLPNDQTVDLDLIADVILDADIVKYVTLRVYASKAKQNFKYIVRGYRNRVWGSVPVISGIPNGQDNRVMRKVKKEMAEWGVEAYDVVGWGRTFHHVSVKMVTFFEEDKNSSKVTANGHSEQCYWARRLIDEGRLAEGYHTYHVDKNGQTSPESKRRQLQRSLMGNEL